MLFESEDIRRATRSQDQKSKGQALKRTTYHNHGIDDPEDHLKIFQAAVKVERWAMPTWCHMFNSTLTGTTRVWFDDLPLESVDSYDYLKKAFLANFLQKKKCIKDLVEIHHIKQREGESIEYFVQRFKAESRHVKGASKCIRISGFMHGITNPELIKCLHDNIPKSVDEMIRVTTAFLRGEVIASNQVRKKTLPTLRPEVKNQIVPATAPLIGFSREIIWSMGQILLPVKIGDAEHSTSTWINFMVVRSPSSYNGIIGRKGARKIQALPSTTHGMLKLPVLGGILTLRSSKIIPLECTMVFEAEAQPSSITRAAKEKIRVAIHLEYTEQTIAMGSNLTEEGRKALCELLRRNLGIFS
nr:reverse transcriptase domain-containing protein [Tanacetum cinerariifolium]